MLKKQKQPVDAGARRLMASVENRRSRKDFLRANHEKILAMRRDKLTVMEIAVKLFGTFYGIADFVAVENYIDALPRRSQRYLY